MWSLDPRATTRGYQELSISIKKCASELPTFEVIVERSVYQILMAPRETERKKSFQVLFKLRKEEEKRERERERDSESE